MASNNGLNGQSPPAGEIDHGWLGAVDSAAAGYGLVIGDAVRRTAAAEAMLRDALIQAGCEVCHEPVAVTVVRQLPDLAEDPSQAFDVGVRVVVAEDVHFFCNVHAQDLVGAALDRLGQNSTTSTNDDRSYTSPPTGKDGLGVSVETEPTDRIDVYPVGWLAAWQHRRMGHLGRELRSTITKVRQGKWREIRMMFNGYLAEPYKMPSGVHRCGSGWTRSRALRSWERHARGAV